MFYNMWICGENVHLKREEQVLPDVTMLPKLLTCLTVNSQRTKPSINLGSWESPIFQIRNS